MPAIHNSLGGPSSRPGATPNYMTPKTPKTPRTPKTPDEHGNLVKKAGFSSRHHKSREEKLNLMDRVRRNGAKKRNGNSFDLPPLPDDLPRAAELVQLRETYATSEMDSLEALRALGRSQKTEVAAIDYSALTQERHKLYKQGIHHMVEEARRERMQDAFLDILVGYEDEQWPPRSSAKLSGSRAPKSGQQPAQEESPMVILDHEVRMLNLHSNDIRERLDYAHSKTMIAIRGAAREQSRLEERESRRKAEMLDKIPSTYEAWKELDEGRRARVGRFLKAKGEQKEAEVERRRWNRDDAMMLHEAYKTEGQFQADVDSLLAARVTTDPRRRRVTISHPADVMLAQT